MRDLNDLSLYVAVVANGGVSAAARALGLPKSRISRRVAALERELGLTLVDRSTRRLAVTEAGQDVYNKARAVLSETEAIEDVVAKIRAEPQGLVRISCPLGVDRLLGAALPAFLARYPRLRVQVLISNRRVDLIEEGVDVAVRVRERLDTDAELQVRTIGRSGLAPVASPGFLETHGQPASPADLVGFPTIGQSDLPGQDHWTLVSSAGERAEVTLEPRLAAGSLQIRRDAAIAGLGIALLPEFVALDLIAQGRLVRVLPDWVLPQGVVHLVFTSRRGLLPSVRAVIDFAAEALQMRSSAWSSIVRPGPDEAAATGSSRRPGVAE
jgi:DNA-binding transcriptional LysR family regulator